MLNIFLFSSDAWGSFNFSPPPCIASIASSVLKDEIKSLQEQIKVLNQKNEDQANQLQALLQKRGEYTEEKRRLEECLAAKNKLIRNKERNESKLQQERDQLTSEIALLRTQISFIQDQFIKEQTTSANFGKENEKLTKAIVKSEEAATRHWNEVATLNAKILGLQSKIDNHNEKHGKKIAEERKKTQKENRENEHLQAVIKTLQNDLTKETNESANLRGFLNKIMQEDNKLIKDAHVIIDAAKEECKSMTEFIKVMGMWENYENSLKPSILPEPLTPFKVPTTPITTPESLAPSLPPPTPPSIGMKKTAEQIREDAVYGIWGSAHSEKCKDPEEKLRLLKKARDYCSKDGNLFDYLTDLHKLIDVEIHAFESSLNLSHQKDSFVDISSEDLQFRLQEISIICTLYQYTNDNIQKESFLNFIKNKCTEDGKIVRQLHGNYQSSLVALYDNTYGCLGDDGKKAIIVGEIMQFIALLKPDGFDYFESTIAVLDIDSCVTKAFGEDMSVIDTKRNLGKALEFCIKEDGTTLSLLGNTRKRLENTIKELELPTNRKRTNNYL